MDQNNKPTPPPKYTKNPVGSSIIFHKPILVNPNTNNSFIDDSAFNLSATVMDSTGPNPPKRQLSKMIKSSETAPSQLVKFMLGENINEHPKVFCEMQSIHRDKGQAIGIWKEQARWITFEEDVEDGGNKWSKPHVATLSLHSLLELRSFFTSGTILLEMMVNDMETIIESVLDDMVEKNQLEDNIEILNLVKRQLLADHYHQNNCNIKEKHKYSDNSLPQKQSITDNLSSSVNSFQSKRRTNKFLRHIPIGSEAANILVGTMDCLKSPIMAFIRLKNATILKNLCEVDIPSRFIFILIGGPKFTNYFQIGRSVSTLMSDDIFHEVAYKAKDRKDLIAGLDEFLDQTTIIPPGEWDPRIRIEPPAVLPNKNLKSRLNRNPFEVPDDENPNEDNDEDEALKRSGKLFGGLINDVKRKAPWYISDFRDCFSLQCLSSYIFLYFAVITPVITFGGLWGDATKNEIAAIESLIGAAISGCVYHLFSGQPLTIIGATGPILVFDTILFDLCEHSFDIPFLNFRFWIGFWTTLFIMIIVATDASSLVKYITRYTEESFSTLISLIFIFDGLNKILSVNKKNTFWAPYNKNHITLDHCNCIPPKWDQALITDPSQHLILKMRALESNLLNTEWTFEHNFTKSSKDLWDDEFRGNSGPYLYKYDNSTSNKTDYYCLRDQNFANLPFYSHKTNEIPPKNITTLLNTNLQYFEMPLSTCEKYCGNLTGNACGYTRDIYLFSLMLSFCTFILATFLKGYKTQRFLSTKARQIISDFGVTLAIIFMVLVDMYFGIATPKLSVPSQIQPTNPSLRGWFIHPMGTEDRPISIKYILLAIFPALLATILVFLDQQITAVIVNRRENKLKKGTGYHLDLFIVGVMIMVCSTFGLPWFVAATVLSITHVNSLKTESSSSAPGEKPTFLGVREQRVTGFLIFLTIGLSVRAVSVLSKIPMPVLYGVFLYMGISSLNNVQLFDRLKLFFIPEKHQPDYIYLRHVPLGRVKMFTLIQIGGLALLWIIKKSKPYSIMFPLMVAAIVFIRKSFDWLNVFSQRELSWLDDVMPEENKRKRKKAKKNDTPRRLSMAVGENDINISDVLNTSMCGINSEDKTLLS